VGGWGYPFLVSRRPNLARALFILLIAIPVHAQFLGFDRNYYPGDGNLPILHQSFAFTGYWLNNPPGASRNTWKGKRELVERAGFGFLVLFNGRLDRELKNSDPAQLGNADAASAVAAAIEEGFPRGTTIFLDQEEGGRLLPEQKQYLFTWIDEVNGAGFHAGVYCSGIPVKEVNTQTIVTADDIRATAGNRKISFFIFNDACPPSSGCVLIAPISSKSGVNVADVWQFAQSPRRPEYTAACVDTYARDGNCYPPHVDPELHLHVDLDSATSADPSHGRTRRDSRAK
jgi:hypothetical protein